MQWWREASRGAAHEFGRRHYRLFAGFALLRSAWRPLLVLLAAGAVAGGVWALRSTSVAVPGDTVALTDTTAAELHAWVKPVLIGAGVVLVVTVTALVWRRWGVILRMYWPLGDAAAVALFAGLLLGGAAAAWVWLP